MIKMLHNRLLVLPDAVEEKTKSGIILGQKDVEKPQRGLVVSVGSGRKDDPMTIKEGDTIMYSKYVGTPITYEGVNYLMMTENDVLTIV